MPAFFDPLEYEDPQFACAAVAEREISAYASNSGQVLEGVVCRIVYENPENGFFIGKLRLASGEVITFVGNLMAISAGETIRITGNWEEDRRYGKQFRVSTYETILPGKCEDIEAYLGSGLIEGIGPIYAKRLVQAFGVETLRVIDEHPERLMGVQGIGKKRAGQIRASWRKQKGVQSIMLFLQGHGIATGQAVRIYRHYGDAAVAVLRANPYRLAQDIDGIGFLSADRIAHKLGIDAGAPSRLRAGILFVLETASGRGDVYMPQEDLSATAAEVLGVSPADVFAVMQEMAQERLLIPEGHAWYLPVLLAAEKGCAHHLKRLVAAPLEHVPIHVTNALLWVERHVGIQLSPEQREAIQAGATEKVMVVTGGPGTGKTTLIKSLLAIMEKKGFSFVLTAPTGRAAKRMEAATGHDACTIHRLLEYSPNTAAFQRNEYNPIPTDLLVVDEASMIDVQLAHALLRAIPPGARLILVGDVDQLPPVGPGYFLYDLILSNAVPVVRLKTVFRQAAQSGIIENAHRINQGEMPIFNEHDFFLIERNDPVRALETVVEVAAKRLPARFGLDPRKDIQTLAPMYKGDAGVVSINHALKSQLNPEGETIPKRAFAVGDKVMQTKNNYELDVYNGDVGTIALYDKENDEIEVLFDDERRVLYSREESDHLLPAYCATVHKAQGSEYPAIVLSFLPQHYMMLQRNVLYTAITRGKRIVVIVGGRKAIAAAVNNNKTSARNTRLSDRLRNIL